MYVYTKTCKSRGHGTSFAQFRRGLYFLTSLAVFDITIFTYSFKNQQSQFEAITIVTGCQSSRFQQRPQNYFKTCPEIPKNRNCRWSAPNTKTSCYDTSIDALLVFVWTEDTCAIKRCEFSIVGDLYIDVCCDKVLEFILFLFIFHTDDKNSKM